jgi:hypothetical protein
MRFAAGTLGTILHIDGQWPKFCLVRFDTTGGTYPIYCEQLSGVNAPARPDRSPQTL